MLSKEKVNALAEKIDDLVDWVKITGKPLLGKVLDIADNWGFPAGLQYVNEKLYDKIPESYQDDVERFVDAFVANDYQGVLDSIPQSLDELHDFEALDDDFETFWITTNWQAIVKFVTFWAKKRKKEETED